MTLKNSDSFTRDQIAAMKVDDLLDFWSEDVRVDYESSNLDQHILKVGVLHSKYLKIMVIQGELQREAEKACSKVTAIRTSYYTGKISKEDEQKYGWPPFQFILNGKQLQDQLEIDPIVSAGRTRVATHSDMVEACKLIIAEIKNRSFQLKAALDWQKIRDGYQT
mgnify:CR=1 FL=1